MRCHNCRGYKIKWNEVRGYSVGFCLHCGTWLPITPPWLDKKFLLQAIRNQHLDLEMEVARELYHEALDEVLNDEEPAPLDVLEAIREMTHIIEAEGPAADMLETLHNLLGKIEGPVVRLDLLEAVRAGDESTE